MSVPAPTEIATRALGPERASACHTLLVVSGQARGNRATIHGLLRIGKAPDNDLVLPDASVSRYHCEIEAGAQGMVVRDLGSTNHTRIGRSKIQTATLEPGATLTVGDVELQLTPESDRLQVLPSASPQFGHAVGPSLAMRQVFGLLERIAPSDATVLLEGETGTGKDVIGRSIHELSLRRAEPFVVVDCGAISYNLIESEFFGHERGAFTGAVQARAGAFETVGKGTLFLDEIGELPLDVQPKLLRVLEAAEFRRVGGNKVQRCEARIIAATRRDLKAEVARGKFREDLYFRLAVVPVTVPALRQRREDIPALVECFLKQARERDGKLSKLTLNQATLDGLMAHDWPGNVRELRNVLDRALYMAAATEEPQLRLVDLPVLATGSAEADAWTFEESQSYRETRTRFEQEFEQRYIRWLLDKHGGNVSAAARAAKMDRKHLHDLARRHGLRDKGGPSE
ncbi:MAG TPA: sigma 54-interacting transcriptional regulator [Polyangiaceae bacterium]|nr:sigma 54-interacting transcriptional regulator [Polyangiaceae bacterium]